MNIIDHIPSRADGAVTRDELAKKTGATDRTNRYDIEVSRVQAENVGDVICNMQDGEGYFLAGSPQHVLQQYNLLFSRANSTILQMNNMARILKKHGIHKLQYTGGSNE